jgi:hypothetical protein
MQVRARQKLTMKMQGSCSLHILKFNGDDYAGKGE